MFGWGWGVFCVCVGEWVVCGWVGGWVSLCGKGVTLEGGGGLLKVSILPPRPVSLTQSYASGSQSLLSAPDHA